MIIGTPGSNSGISASYIVMNTSAGQRRIFEVITVTDLLISS